MELDELFARAIGFYEGCPDGQYDEVAAAALRYMQADLTNCNLTATKIKQYNIVKTAAENV